MLEDVYARLSRVVVECLTWQEALRRYDSDNTLFYLPPHIGDVSGIIMPRSLEISSLKWLTTRHRSKDASFCR